MAAQWCHAARGGSLTEGEAQLLPFQCKHLSAFPFHWHLQSSSDKKGKADNASVKRSERSGVSPCRDGRGKGSRLLRDSVPVSHWGECRDSEGEGERRLEAEKREEAALWPSGGTGDCRLSVVVTCTHLCMRAYVCARVRILTAGRKDQLMSENEETHPNPHCHTVVCWEMQQRDESSECSGHRHHCLRSDQRTHSSRQELASGEQQSRSCRPTVSLSALDGVSL